MADRVARSPARLYSTGQKLVRYCRLDYYFLAFASLPFSPVLRLYPGTFLIFPLHRSCGSHLRFSKYVRVLLSYTRNAFVLDQILCR